MRYLDAVHSLDLLRGVCRANIGGGREVALSGRLSGSSTDGHGGSVLGGVLVEVGLLRSCRSRAVSGAGRQFAMCFRRQRWEDGLICSPIG